MSTDRNLPTSWAQVTLKELLREPLRNGHSARKTSSRDGLRTLTLTAVTKREFSEANTKLTTANPEKVLDLWLRPDDLLVQRANTPELVGIAARYTGPSDWAIFPDLLIRVRVSEWVNPKYMEYLFQRETTRSFFKRHARGSAGSMPKISQQTIEGLAVPLCSTSEQHRIVDEIEKHFTRLDAAMAALERAQANLERYRASVLQAACEGRITKVRMAHETEINIEKKLLSEILAEDLLNGRSVPTQDGGFPVLRLTAIKPPALDLHEAKEGAWTEAEASSFLVRDGDFFVARGSGSLSQVGRGGLAQPPIREVAFPDTMIRVRLQPTECCASYLALVWDAPSIRRQIRQRARTTAGIHKINQGDLKAVQVPLPTLDEQASIVTEVERRLSLVEEVDREISVSLARATRLRQSILKRAFEGRLIPQDPDDEPASVLLERIRAEREDAKSKTEKKRGPKARRQRRAEKPSPTGA